MKKLFAITAMLVLSGCHFVPEGHVGLRVNYDGTVEREERLPGSPYQVLWGHYLDAQIREVSVDVDDVNPQAADNSTMSDFDVNVVYSINPGSAADLYIDKSKPFHDVDGDKKILLMHSYLKTVVRNAVFKTARLYPAMKMNDFRSDIEAAILKNVHEVLAAEKLDTSVIVTKVLVKNMLPSKAVKDSADALVAAQSALQAKDTELQTAKKEAERIATLNANAGAIPYMNAQANLEIARAVAAGKVSTIIVPYDFKGMVNAK